MNSITGTMIIMDSNTSLLKIKAADGGMVTYLRGLNTTRNADVYVLNGWLEKNIHPSTSWLRQRQTKDEKPDVIIIYSPVCCPPDDVEGGGERPLIPEPADKSSGSLRLCGVQFWEEVLREESNYQHFKSSLHTFVFKLELKGRSEQ